VKPNTLATLSLLVRDNAGSGGLWIYNPSSLTSYGGQPVPVTGWRMRGGPGDPFAKTGWAPLPASARFSGPQFFRTIFIASAGAAAMPSTPGAHAIWRVNTTGLGHGSIWVNGHNLGRYPQYMPLGAYIPECWLKAGENSLVIYDEDGKSPAKVSIEAEAIASRDVREIEVR
jgi:beta-galactosidase